MGKRPELSGTMNTKVTNELEKHLEDKYKGEKCPKTRPQRSMSPDTRKEKIQMMLDKSGYKLGIAPLTSDHIERVQKWLKSKGLFKTTDSNVVRKPSSQ